jgi:hypothetical protein
MPSLLQVDRDQQAAAGGFDSSWIVDLRERALLPAAIPVCQVLQTKSTFNLSGRGISKSVSSGSCLGQVRVCNRTFFSCFWFFFLPDKSSCRGSGLLDAHGCQNLFPTAT